MVEAGFTKIMMVVLRSERTERVGHADIWGRALQMEETAGINVLRQEPAWCAQPTEGSPLWLKHNEQRKEQQE